MTGVSGRRLRRSRAAGAAVAVLALLAGGCADQVTPPGAGPEQPAGTSAPAAPATTEAGPGPAALPRSRPVTLEIPAIGVRTGEIIELGLEPDGALEVPEDAVTTGWYDQSPTPGEVGPSIIAGHVDYDHVPGVFHRLHELPVGAEVVVHRADGTTVHFEVDRVERFPKAEFPTELVYGNTEAPELRLITCGGAFDDSSGNYVDNVIAFATMTEAGR
ncbi:sortase family protein [Prauserella shujinwangii]|uniref:Sortase family protein n=1 Tax=Prauserella shujinwangii TaxID=1453103 RepID=A0A2T0LVK9_9PSEU|nr:class F sortase [Prauserella shujinwangii]PRX47883.1 sortase family protein [Prauserella shujinwangii]